MILADFVYILFRPFGFIAPKTLNYSAVLAYPMKAIPETCRAHLIDIYLFNKFHSCQTFGFFLFETNWVCKLDIDQFSFCYRSMPLNGDCSFL
jgi:hypothetical protein